MENEEVNVSEQIGMIFEILKDMSKNQQQNPQQRKLALTKSKFAHYSESEHLEDDSSDDELSGSVMQTHVNNLPEDDDEGTLGALNEND